LKARVFIERGIARIADHSLVGQLLVVRFARTRWTEIDHFPSVFVDQQQVLVGMSLLLAAVMRCRRRSEPSIAKSDVPSNAKGLAAMQPASRSGLMPKSANACCNTGSN
jgi:hypothetical protein